MSCVPTLPSELWSIILSHGGSLELSHWVRVDPRHVAAQRIQSMYRQFSRKIVEAPWNECKVRLWRRIPQAWRSGTLLRWRFASLLVDDWVVELDGDMTEIVYLHASRYPHPLMIHDSARSSPEDKKQTRHAVK